MSENEQQDVGFSAFRVPMRDGIELESELFLPEGSGPFPALLARCTYGTDKTRAQAAKLARHGYAVLIQDVRGRRGSGGEFDVGRSSPEDGYDTLDWMVKQSWCSGRIGTFGGSALGAVQVATALLAHPAHCVMSPRVLPYGMMRRLGGNYMFSQIVQWLYFTASGNELNPYDTVDWMPHLSRLPVVDVLNAVGGPIEAVRERLTHPHSNEYWGQADPERIHRLNTPCLLITGWYDHCSSGAIDFFMQTQ